MLVILHHFLPQWYRCKSHKSLAVICISSTLFAAVALGTENHYLGYISEVMVIRNVTVCRGIVIFQMGLLSVNERKSTVCYRLMLDDLPVKSTFNNMEQNYILYQK
jgi:hypothetical protein